MQKLPVFRENALGQLVSDIRPNLTKYKSEKSWVDDVFPGRVWSSPSKIADLPEDLLLLPDESSDHDLENAQRLYEALHGLTLIQASDPRLWTYLAHVTFWRYMRKRWPIEKRAKGEDLESGYGTVLKRYFLVGDRSRGVIRHGIARLWWAGYTCYIEGQEPEQSFALAKPLFSKQDVYASFMERAFSKNKTLMQAVLRPLLKRYTEGRPFDVRDEVRALAKHLVLVGGVTILDAIDSAQMESIVEAYIQQREASEI
ncbi:DUF6339 family protein [Burkholderia cenocepacia]|uniref:DUF6339 family protein n=1 Tax=Burkholderia cenocepacia TaxID=95486 RepID=UPI0012EC672C|nr:DUF6339 family protein [Burkholderia cenocepacia]MBR7941035.1 hypothetical protein [Burkholderia cenocepacia]MBR8121358.1 hypothetical protein [Burkholderia cenocepacia]MCW3678817.1 hypothetical protein [Burkholderia cenocepacia]MDC6086739.1 DUF6339 family protein [Burkholderia cenocepacia]